MELADLIAGLRARRDQLNRELDRIAEADDLLERGLALAREVLGDGALPLGSWYAVRPEDAQEREGEPGQAMTRRDRPAPVLDASGAERQADKPTSAARSCERCSTTFTPDPRAAHRARYCSRECKVAAANEAAKERRRQAAGRVGPSGVSEPATTPNGSPAVPSLPPVRAFETKRCPKCLDTFVAKDQQQRYCSATCEAEAMTARAAVGLPPPGREQHEHRRA